MNLAQLLCAIEVNEEARHIFNVAERVAGFNEADIHLVNVIKPPLNVYADLGFTPLAERTCEWQREVRAHNRAELSKVAPQLAESASVIEGYPAQEISELAQSQKADLIVMGLHNKSGFAKLLGSTTHSVLNQTSCDLLAVHPDAKPAYRRVLIAVDTSSGAEVAMQKAHAYTGQADEVKILTVQEPLGAIYMTPYGGLGTDSSIAQLNKQMHTELETRIRDAAQANDFDPAVVELTTGEPRRAIIDAAEQWEADLIIMGSHNHGMMERLLLGSTTHGVLNHSSCDVLVCRENTTPKG